MAGFSSRCAGFRRGGTAPCVGDQEGAEIVEAGGAPEMPEPLALGVDRGVVFVRYIGDGMSCPALSTAGTLRICPGTSKR